VEQAAAMSLWGLMALRLRQYDVADERFARASRLDPSLDLAVSNRGVVAEEKGDLIAAMTHYRRAVEIDPRSALANGNLGRALCRLKQCDQGLRYLNAAVALEPWNPLVAINVGVGLAASGRLGEAEQAHREAAFTHPGEPEVFRALGRFHQERVDDLTRRSHELTQAESDQLDRHVAQAERAYERAVQLAPMNPQFHLDLGNVLYLRVIHKRATDIGRTLALAREAYSKAIALDDRFALAYRNRGMIDFMRNDLQTALRDLTRAIELDPSSRDSHCAIAEAYAAIGNQELERAARAKCQLPAPPS
jgi:tetratricopeptide (TPR) repeat protein